MTTRTAEEEQLRRLIELQKKRNEAKASEQIQRVEAMGPGGMPHAMGPTSSLIDILTAQGIDPTAGASPTAPPQAMETVGPQYAESPGSWQNWLIPRVWSPDYWKQHPILQAIQAGDRYAWRPATDWFREGIQDPMAAQAMGAGMAGGVVGGVGLDDPMAGMYDDQGRNLRQQELEQYYAQFEAERGEAPGAWDRLQIRGDTAPLPAHLATDFGLGFLPARLPVAAGQGLGRGIRAAAPTGNAGLPLRAAGYGIEGAVQPLRPLAYAEDVLLPAALGGIWRGGQQFPGAVRGAMSNMDAWAKGISDRIGGATPTAQQTPGVPIPDDVQRQLALGQGPREQLLGLPPGAMQEQLALPPPGGISGEGFVMGGRGYTPTEVLGVGERAYFPAMGRQPGLQLDEFFDPFANYQSPPPDWTFDPFAQPQAQQATGRPLPTAEELAEAFPTPRETADAEAARRQARSEAATRGVERRNTEVQQILERINTQRRSWINATTLYDQGQYRNWEAFDNRMEQLRNRGLVAPSEDRTQWRITTRGQEYLRRAPAEAAPAAEPAPTAAAPETPAPPPETPTAPVDTAAPVEAPTTQPERVVQPTGYEGLQGITKGFAQQVAGGLRRGLSPDEIATELGVTRDEVANAIGQIMENPGAVSGAGTPARAPVDPSRVDAAVQSVYAMAESVDQIVQQVRRLVPDATRADVEASMQRQGLSPPQTSGSPGPAETGPAQPAPRARQAQAPREVPEGAAGADALPIKVVKGNPTTAYRGASGDVDLDVALVELDDLVTSHQANTFAVDPRFPPELQGRNRDSAAMQATIANILTRYRPRDLFDPPGSIRTGTPIVGEYNGNVIVESGNGRVITLGDARRVTMDAGYEPANTAYEGYRTQLLKELEKHGLSEIDLANFNKPVLVRVRKQPMTMEERIAFTDEANTRETEGLSAAEVARSDAQLLSPSMFASKTFREGQEPPRSIREWVKQNEQAVSADFLARLRSEERNTLLGERGTLTAAAYDRLERGAFLRVFGNDARDLIDRLMVVEEEAGTVRITKAIEDNLGTMLRYRFDVDAGMASADLDLAPPLKEALRLLEHVMTNNFYSGSIANRVRQYFIRGNMLTDTDVDSSLLLTVLGEVTPQTGRALDEVIETYYQKIFAFGRGSGAPSRASLLLDTINDVKDPSKLKRGNRTPALTGNYDELLDRVQARQAAEAQNRPTPSPFGQAALGDDFATNQQTGMPIGQGSPTEGATPMLSQRQEDALRAAQERREMLDAGQTDMFGDAASPPPDRAALLASIADDGAPLDVDGLARQLGSTPEAVEAEIRAMASAIMEYQTGYKGVIFPREIAAALNLDNYDQARALIHKLTQPPFHILDRRANGGGYFRREAAGGMAGQDPYTGRGQGLGPEGMEQAPGPRWLEEGLQRGQTELRDIEERAIDQILRRKPDGTPFPEVAQNMAVTDSHTAAVLRRMHRQGKVKYLGYDIWAPADSQAPEYMTAMQRNAIDQAATDVDRLADGRIEAIEQLQAGETPTPEALSQAGQIFRQERLQQANVRAQQAKAIAEAIDVDEGPLAPPAEFPVNDPWEALVFGMDNATPSFIDDMARRFEGSQSTIELQIRQFENDLQPIYLAMGKQPGNIGQVETDAVMSALSRGRAESLPEGPLRDYATMIQDRMVVPTEHQTLRFLLWATQREPLTISRILKRNGYSPRMKREDLKVLLQLIYGKPVRDADWQKVTRPDLPQVAEMVGQYAAARGAEPSKLMWKKPRWNLTSGANFLHYDPDTMIWRIRRMLDGHGGYVPEYWAPKPGESAPPSALPKTRPSHVRPRSYDTYELAREAGEIPVVWDPAQIVLRDMRERMHFQLKDSYAVSMAEQGMLKDASLLNTVEAKAMKVPRVGTPFEGFVPVEGPALPSYAVPNWSADHLEQLEGVRASFVVDLRNIPGSSVLGRIPGSGRVMRENVDLTSVYYGTSDAMKFFKFFLSPHQIFDMLRRFVGASALPTVTTPGGIGAARQAGLSLNQVFPALGIPEAFIDSFKMGFSWTSNRQARLTHDLLDDTPLFKGRSISHRRYVQIGGLTVGADSSVRSVIRKGLTEAVDLAEVQMPYYRALWRQTREWVQGMMFDAFYTNLKLKAMDRIYVPQLLALHPDWSDIQVMQEASRMANIVFSSQGAWQRGFISNAKVLSAVRPLVVSSNEYRAWFSMLVEAIPSTRNTSWPLFLRQMVGSLLFLGFLMESIKYGMTGEHISPGDINPFSGWTDGIFGFGMSPDLLSPTLDLEGRGGRKVRLDLLEQMDTALRAIDQSSFWTNRFNMPIRTIYNQVTGTNFVGDPLDSGLKRLIQLTLDIMPIPIEGSVQAARAAFPSMQEHVPGGEERLGVAGNLLQAWGGVNLRSETNRQLRDRFTKQWGYADSYNEAEPYQKREILQRIAEATGDELRVDAMNAHDRKNSAWAVYAYKNMLAKDEAKEQMRILGLRARRASGRDEQRAIVNDYWDNKAQALHFGDGLRTGFEDEFDFGDREPEGPLQEALDAYYNLPAVIEEQYGYFDGEAYSDLKARFLNSINIQALEYVLRNTNLEEVPESVMRILRRYSKNEAKEIDASREARRRHGSRGGNR